MGWLSGRKDDELNKALDEHKTLREEFKEIKKDFDIVNLQGRMRKLEDQFQQLTADNDSHKEDLAETKKRVEALESKIKRLIEEN